MAEPRDLQEGVVGQLEVQRERDHRPDVREELDVQLPGLSLPCVPSQ